MNLPAQSDPLALAQTLWSQHDIESLLRTLEAHLTCRVNIVLTDGQRLAGGCHFLDDAGRLQHVSEHADTPGGRVLDEEGAQRTVYDGATVVMQFPHVVRLAPYRQAGVCMVCPLIAGRQFLGAIEFILHDTSIDESSAAFLERVAALVADALARIQDEQSEAAREESAQRERTQLQVLVDITNTVLSTLDVSHLARDVAASIRRFFGIDHVGLNIFDEGRTVCHAWEVQFRFNGSAQQDHRDMSPAESLGWRAIQNGEAWFGDERALQLLAAGGSSGAARLLEDGFAAACALPLISGQKIVGTLNLAHGRSLALFRENAALLQQVAARIALGLDNALAYQEISRLRDQLASENSLLEEEIRNYKGFDEIVGSSLAMASVLEQVEMVAASDCSVLILGETGTGKELVARAIHAMSRRREQRMVTVSCAAIPAGLLESDLFGHEKGAFTGAAAQRLGRFETANKGTLFLDEVGDLPLDLQPKLLRVLQEREIERVGGNQPIPVDVRVIAATCRDLPQMVVSREYRSDLYYRLNVFPITVPPLRDRPEDIPQLANFFTRRIARRMNRNIESIPAEAMERLLRHPWPGNVRELQNVIERAVILSRGNTLKLPPIDLQSDMLPEPVVHAFHPIPAGRQAPLDEESADSERERIISALRETRGIVAGPRGAAVLLGLKRTTLLSRMQRFGITVKSALGLEEA